MNQSTMYIDINSRSEYIDEGRCGGWSTSHTKTFKCAKCKQPIGTGYKPSTKFCPNCGTELNGKTDDFFIKKAKSLIAKDNRLKKKLLSEVNGSNYYKISGQIANLDEDIKDLNEAICNWKKFGSGSLPVGYGKVMNR